MLFTKEERIEMARNIMQRLNIGLAGPNNSRPHDGEDNTFQQPTQIFLDPLYLRERVSSQNLLEQLGPLPPHTTLIGLCEDGLPLLFDLSDPTPGPILVSGQAGTGKTRLLKTILMASCMLNTPDEFRFFVISPEPGKFRELSYLDHGMDFVSSFDRAAVELIVNLSAIAEQRRCGRFLGPTTILAIDDLDALLKVEEFELTNHLKWLLENGPRNGIWPLATIRQESMNLVNPKLLANFKTSLVASNGMYQLLPGRNLLVDRLVNPFSARVGQQRINFWIPDLI